MSVSIFSYQKLKLIIYTLVASTYNTIMIMKKVRIILYILFSLTAYDSTAQYDFLQLSLEVGGPTKENSYVKLTLYRKMFNEDIAQYLIDVKAVKKIKESHLIDTTYIITKEQFNKISELAMSISSTDILKGMNPHDPTVYQDAGGCKLTLQIFQESICYNVLAPRNETKDRNLSTFLQTCEELIKTAQLKPDKVFE